MSTSDLPHRFPSLGSLTGFIRDPDDGSSDLVNKGWSIEELKRFLMNEDNQNFATPEWLVMVSKVINEHIADTNNPHRVTLDQVSPEIVRNIVSKIIAGTPPLSDPAFALNPAVELPLGDMVPASHSLTNALRLTGARNFNIPSAGLTTDYLTGRAGFGLFSSITNVLNNNWQTNQDPALHSTLAPITYETVNWPFSFFSVSEQDADSQFGVSFPLTTEVNKSYSVQFLVKNVNEGCLLFCNKSDPAKTSLIDPILGTITNSDPSVRLTVISQIDDLWLVCFSFIATQAQTTIYCTHLDPGQITPTRQGIANRPLFVVARPVATLSTGIVPFPVSASATWGSSPVIPDLSKADVPASVNEFIVNLRFYLQTGVGPAPVDTLLFQIGVFRLTRTATQWQASVNGTVICTDAIVDGVNVWAISYSPTEIIVKCSGKPRFSAKATYPSLLTNNVQIGPCDGYLLGFYFYPNADRNFAVEFLTDG